jgi:hypothetical protein
MAFSTSVCLGISQEFVDSWDDWELTLIFQQDEPWKKSEFLWG